MILLSGPDWPVVGHPYGAHTEALEAMLGKPPAARPPMLDLFGAMPETPASSPTLKATPRVAPEVRRCGARLVWSWVPPREDEDQSPGEATCARCGTIVYAWPNAYGRLTQTQADATVEAVVEDGDEEDDATFAERMGITPAVRAAVATWLSALPTPRTPAQRSDIITAWLASDLAGELERGGAHGGYLLGVVCAALPRLETDHVA